MTPVVVPPRNRGTTLIDMGALRVPRLGLGCMGMSGSYGPADWDGSIATIRLAVELGVTFLDTANVYGFGHNEVLVGQAVRGRRDRVQIATKLGIDRSGGGPQPRIRGDAAYVRQAIDESLLRLGVDTVDLYYVHRPSPDVPIEETFGEMSNLVRAGKVRELGLSNVGEDVLRRAHALHPVAAVQFEYSLWTRQVESLAPVLAESGIALVPYSPLGRGLLTGTLTGQFGPTDKRRGHPRFSGGMTAEHVEIVRLLTQVAERHSARPSQIALAWVIGQGARLGIPIVPIPGTKNPRWLVENLGALDVELDDHDIALLEPIAERVGTVRLPEQSLLGELEP